MGLQLGRRQVPSDIWYCCNSDYGHLHKDLFSWILLGLFSSLISKGNVKLPNTWLVASERNASWKAGIQIQRGRERSGPQQSVPSPSKRGQSCSLSSLALQTVYPGREPLSSYHTTRSEQQIDFQESWNLFPTQTWRCVSAAIACHRRLDKHAESTTSETYRHLSANLNVEMWLLHFQSVHQEKSEHKAVIGTRHTSPCSAREAQSQLQQPRKLGWISWRLGENENISDLHRSNTSPDGLQRPIMLENMILYPSLKGNIPYIPFRYLKAEMNC